MRDYKEEIIKRILKIVFEDFNDVICKACVERDLENGDLTIELDLGTGDPDYIKLKIEVSEITNEL